MVLLPEGTRVVVREADWNPLDLAAFTTAARHGNDVEVSTPSMRRIPAGRSANTRE
jgi:hypothetical protein